MVSGGPESSSVPQATSSTVLIPTSNSNSVATSNNLNVGAIAGGVVGGVFFIGIVGGLIVFTIRRRGKRSALPPSTYTPYASPQTMISDVDMKYSAIPTMTSGKIYVSPASLNFRHILIAW